MSNDRTRHNVVFMAALTVCFAVMAVIFVCDTHAAEGAVTEERGSHSEYRSGTKEEIELADTEACEPGFGAEEAVTETCESGFGAEEAISEAYEPLRNREDAVSGSLILENPSDKTQYAAYDVTVGDTFSIEFIHSVNKSPVIDYFEIREDGIYGIKTVYYGFGAGVPTDLAEGQELTYGEDDSMIISGFDLKLSSLIYRVGTVSDHILTLEDGTEISLRDLCGRSARVGFRFEVYENGVRPH